MSKLRFEFKGGFYNVRHGKKLVARARVNEAGNYACNLFVHKSYRRQGIGTLLLEFIMHHRSKQLNRAPDAIKNDAVRALSAKMGDALGEEAPLQRDES